jgi:thiol-disulfide isomerase/thioredoxin
MQNNKKLNIRIASELAKQKGGKCLSAVYVNVDAKLIWQCEFGHTWETSLYNVRKNNSWCPHCAGVAKLSLDAMRELAKSKGGKCLSTKYKNAAHKLLWECRYGHQWEALPGPMRCHGTWCPYCAGKAKLDLRIMQELAKSRGGKCLSTEYVDNGTKLKWECELGHQWEATSASVKCNESWCPACGGRQKLSLEDMKILANNKKGRCLSTEYKNIDTKLIWQCEFGHQWEANARDVKSGRWCPHCHSSKRKGENAVREFFKNVFNKNFPSSRPPWLIYEEKKLELDGYCKEIQIAFEYQGSYHYNKKAYWYPDKTTTFERRQLLDAHKIKACKENLVKLIIVNEFNPFKKPEVWKEIIKQLLIENGIKVPLIFDTIPFGAVEFHTSTNYKNVANDIAKSRGGKCLSKKILYRTQLADWECKYEHQWTASLRQVDVLKTWCPECAGRRRLTIKHMQQLAKEKNGKCLSTEYKNGRCKLLWECEFGHRWEAVASSIKNNGTWCPQCTGLKTYSIEDMRSLAIARKGECLSKKYKGNKKKLIWKCEQSHTWEATPSSISNHKSWCPICGGSFKLTITQMQELAKLKGGKCLSTKYTNARTKLLWECHIGHKWLAVPDKIKNLGRWCRQCPKSN